MKKTAIVNTFNGGMVNDPRDPRENVAQVIQHFDILTDSHRLVPQLTSEVGDGSASTNKITNFAYDGTTLYGLADDGSGNVYVKKLTDFSTTTWSNVRNPGNLKEDKTAPFFTYYRNQDKLYGIGSATGTYYVWSVNADGASSAQQSSASLGTTCTSVSNGIVHSKDDVLYAGFNNLILSKNGSGSWNVSALTLPSQYLVMSICEYGDYLAIGCRNRNSGTSRVFLWDRNETTLTLSQSIDWENGDLYVLEELEGYLIGVSSVVNNAIGNYRTIFRYYAGTGGAIKFAEFKGVVTTPTENISQFKTKTGHRILFNARMSVGATTYSGVFAITKAPQGFAITQDFSLLQTISTATLPYGIIQLGDYVFISYQNTSTYYVDKTNATATYTTVSMYISSINPKMPPLDKGLLKSLKSVALFTAPLSSGQQATLEYRVNGSAWSNVVITKAATDTDTVGTEKNLTTAGITDQGREFEFRLKSTGGAVIIGFAYTYEILSNSPLI